MAPPVISVEKLSKQYLVGHRAPDGMSDYVAIRDVVAREFRNVTRKAADFLRGRQIVQGDEVEEFWALKDVSFEIEEGEVFGIIGRNGAGKSTLLKILSRITEPTAGRVTIHGRIASMLEVGTGFHPELSGRENVYLNGMILGMSRAEIRRKFDEIVAFAEVEKFLDTPVKRYSSGMYVRLAFAVAAHLEPQILIVDEVLSVGDAEFQAKCQAKMQDISRREGRTVIVVSHNMPVITELCSKAIWMDHGSIREHGASRAVVEKYLPHKASAVSRFVQFGGTARNDQRVQLESLEWLSELPLRHGEPVKARITFRARVAVPKVAIGIGFSNREGTRLLTYNTDFQDGPRPDLAPGENAVVVNIEAFPLLPAIYSLDIGCRSGNADPLDYVPGCTQIEVAAGASTPSFLLGSGATVHLASEWSWSLAQRVDELRLVP